MVVCDEALKRMGMNREATRVIVQGFGNVGSNAAKLMNDSGYKIIGVIEFDGALHNKNGIDLKELVEFRRHLPGKPAQLGGGRLGIPSVSERA